MDDASLLDSTDFLEITSKAYPLILDLAKMILIQGYVVINIY